MKAKTRTLTWPVLAGATLALLLGGLTATLSATDSYTAGLSDKVRQHASTPLQDSGAGAIEDYEPFGVDTRTKQGNSNVDLKRALRRDGKTLDHVAAETQMLSVLAQAMAAAQLADTIAAQEPVTIFAPTDEAFAKWTKHDRSGLFDPANAPELRRLVAQHVVRGKVSWADLAGRTVRLRTLAGTELVINGTNGIQVGAARIEISDVLAANGVIHIIDSVLATKDSRAAIM